MNQLFSYRVTRWIGGHYSESVATNLDHESALKQESAEFAKLKADGWQWNDGWQTWYKGYDAVETLVIPQEET